MHLFAVIRFCRDNPVPEESGGVRPPLSVLFPFPSPKGTEGQQRRGSAAESVAARNQTTAGPNSRLESRRLHAAPRAGFYWPFSITPVTLDWVCGSVSFSWKGQSRLQGQARLKWIMAGMRANRAAGYLNCKSGKSNEGIRTICGAVQHVPNSWRRQLLSSPRRRYEKKTYIYINRS